MKKLLPCAMRSITFDNGSKNAQNELTNDQLHTQTPVFLTLITSYKKALLKT